MASISEHTANLRDALAGAGYSADEIESMAPYLAEVLKVLEESHLQAIYELALIRGEEPSTPAGGDEAEGEFAFALYWLHNTPPRCSGRY